MTMTESEKHVVELILIDCVFIALRVQMYCMVTF